jgi:hypothetical protein
VKASPPHRLGVWLLAAVALAIACSLFYLAAFNWWAGGGPPTPEPQVFIARGNAFALMGGVALTVFAAVLYRLVRRRVAG